MTSIKRKIHGMEPKDDSWLSLAFFFLVIVAAYAALVVWVVLVWTLERLWVVAVLAALAAGLGCGLGLVWWVSKRILGVLP